MSTEILETSPLYRLWVARAQEQGVAQGLREAALDVLRRRFGEPPSDMVEALAGMSTADLHEIVALAATGTLDEVRARLGA
jgi:hypothetical protein